MRRIMVINEQKEELDRLTQILFQPGYSVQSVQELSQALHRFRTWKPQLVCLRVSLPQLKELELISKIRLMSVEDYCTILLLCERSEPEAFARLMESGADDFWMGPIDELQLHARVRASFRHKEVHDSLKRASHRIEELVLLDDLTGLMNIRAVYRKGEEEITRAHRMVRPISAILINLDGFSLVNQSCGFLIGSQVLQDIARHIRTSLRKLDLIARIGADEFFIVLPDTDLTHAQVVAEKIRELIQQIEFNHLNQSFSLTASLGVAGLTPDQTNQRMGDLLHLTIEALKSAKASGPNRIEVYSFS
ncbi:MAG: GGDEF domain-containing response regulator [Bdellovibrionia bacterium]